MKKIEKLGEKLRSEILREVNHALDHVNSEIGAVKQFLPRLKEAMTGKKNAAQGELQSEELLPKSLSKTMEMGDFSHGTGPLLQESASLASFLDPSKFTHRRNKFECPRFDGQDFLGWSMKIDQYFDAVKVQDDEKISIVMIHLNGKALQWHQRIIKTRGNI